jgi:hypothetical protein
MPRKFKLCIFIRVFKKNSYHHSATLSFRQTLHHPPSIPFLFSSLFSKALTLKNGNIRRHNYFYSNIESEQLSTPKVLSVANLQTGFLSRADRISTHVTFFHNMNSVWAKFPDSDQRWWYVGDEFTWVATFTRFLSIESFFNTLSRPFWLRRVNTSQDRLQIGISSVCRR